MSLVFAMLVGAAFAGPTEAEDCLQIKLREAYDAGWRFRATESASLADGQTHAIRATLFADTPYRVLACADRAATNLDVLVYRADGTVLTRDDTVSREPDAAFQVPETGAYYIVMYHRQASTPGSTATAAMALGFH